MQAFVAGWVSELHLKGYTAGVYANAGPITNDISKASPLPDDIWITKTGTLPQVTIWNQGISDSLWPNNQRIHQFVIDTKGVQFGTVPYDIDEDIEDAQIVPGQQPTKKSISAFSTIDCAGAVTTLPSAINDMNGSAFINNSSGQIGTIVGTYEEATTFKGHAYEEVNGICSVIDYPGALATWPTGINNAGLVVGYWEDSGGAKHGFQLNKGKASMLDYPGASVTYLRGVNDAGQIVGSAYLQGSGYQDFIYYRAKFYSLVVTGSASINGDGTVAGGYLSGTQNNYVEYTAPPSWNGSPVYLAQISNATLYLSGLNNSSDLVGGLLDSACPIYCGFIFPQGNSAITIFQYPGAGHTVAVAVNDFGQIVGNYAGSDDYGHGLLATRP